jgi:hypothetical protein
MDRMTVTRHWESDGASATYYEGRLSIIAKPSMTADDGSVAVGIDAPWIDQLARAVGALREIRERMDKEPDDEMLDDILAIVDGVLYPPTGGQS